MILKGSNHERLFVILNKGELLVQSLTKVVEDNHIQGGFITGIGALKDVELGYYILEKQTYIRKHFLHEDFELIALNGNISLKEGKPFIHVHAALGRQDFSTFGGHLFEGTVAVTTEISILPLGLMPQRKLDEAIGIALICGA